MGCLYFITGSRKNALRFPERGWIWSLANLSPLRFKFFVWIISGSETILPTADVEFGPRLFVWDIEREEC